MKKRNKYTKKQITEAIVYWKKRLEKMDEPEVRWPAGAFLNEYAKANGYMFRSTKSQTLRDTIEGAMSDLSEYLNKNLQAEFEKKVYDDAEYYGITYHDDSDMDPEYGYGPYGEYDDDEIAEKAGEMVEEEYAVVEDDIDKNWQDWKKSGGGADFAEWCAEKLECYKDEIYIGYNGDYDFGMVMIKED